LFVFQIKRQITDFSCKKYDFFVSCEQNCCSCGKPPHHHSSPTLTVKWSVTYITVYKFSLPCPHFGSFYYNTLVNLAFFLSLHCSHHDRFLFYTIFKYKVVCDKLELSLFVISLQALTNISNDNIRFFWLISVLSCSSLK